MSGIDPPQDDLSKRKYVKYSSDLNKPSESEKEDQEVVKGIFERVIAIDHKAHGHTYPTTHAKTLGVVKGKLIIPDDLPSHLKQGPFAKGGEHAAVLRYSNNLHDVSKDANGRGLSIKVFDVPGERFPEGKGNTTHDFLMNSSMTISELADSRTARDMIGILEKMLTDPRGGYADIMARPDKALQMAPAMEKRHAVPGLTFYSQYAYRFGDYVAKQGLYPATEAQKVIGVKELTAEEKSIQASVDELRKFYSENEAVYELKVQLLENLDEQPVEYAGTPWDEHKYPYQTIAKFVFPKQESFDQDLIKYWEDSLIVDIWRGTTDLEPLGSACRMRRVMYAHSEEIRWKTNPSDAIDVKKIDELPGSVPS